MSGPGFARPDLCSIRTAAGQEELDQAVRSGFSVGCYPLADDELPAPPGGRHRPRHPPVHRGGRAGRRGHRRVCSYGHAYAVVRAHGETGITARLEPATIDGLVYASSMAVLYAARHRVPVPALARWLLGAGIGWCCWSVASCNRPEPKSGRLAGRAAGRSHVNPGASQTHRESEAGPGVTADARPLDTHMVRRRRPGPGPMGALGGRLLVPAGHGPAACMIRAG